MARTAAQIETEIITLKSAMATGATQVRYGDRSVTYKSFEEQRQHLVMLENEMAGASGQQRVRQVRFQTSSGL